ncbi:response regulator [Panacibacter sp. DH6]|uniref:Response regulator n=1 Tax=Panacibacter microcysteis TaxID=2793269 RepID=A0A931EB30_9BACT|nr:response regulator [Panacibacter microcysteis]MBG9377724.1 response regulator [Panacibacter microcysteis]
MLHILIIDTSSTIVDIMEELILESVSGSSLYRAQNFVIARHLLTIVQPDAMLIDMNMPDNGVLSILAERNRICPATKVMIMTNYEDDYLQQKCMENGADFMIDKYYGYPLVIEILQLLWRASE